MLGLLPRAVQRIAKILVSVLLVGHEPLFSALSAFLLGQPNLSIDFKKGALLCVEVYTVRAQPAGVLKWYLTPKFAAS